MPLTRSQTAIITSDASFDLELALQESIAKEHEFNAYDLGPTDRLPEDIFQLEYDLFFGSSPLTTPSSSPSPSRSASPLPRSTSEIPSKPPPPSKAPELSSKLQNSKARRNKERSRQNRKKGRRKQRDDRRTEPFEVKHCAVNKCVRPAKGKPTTFSPDKFPLANGAYICGPDRDEDRGLYEVDELVNDMGFEYIPWDGKTPTPIVYKNAVMAVMAGHPDDPTWEETKRGAMRVIELSREKCHFPLKTQSHRRGEFPALNWGISYGGGQTEPGNLRHNPQNAEVLSALASDEHIARIATYGSTAFALWAPNLYTYYETNFDALLEDDRTLRRNWPNSIFASFAVNFGPKTVCLPHRDFANVPFGWCSITALGDFDPTKGGHLILWDLKLVIEFPPGSTILIPSAAVSHSNVPIGRRETRYSFTQFTAGGLFRWVDQGCQPTGNYTAALTKEGLKEDKRREAERCKLGLSLLSTISSIPTDQTARNKLI